MSRLHRLARKVLGWVDAWYFRRHQLRSLGPVLLLGRAQYRGAEIRFEDGTVLRDHDPIGRLHFNNASIAALGEGSIHRVGFRFARLMRESLRRLAEAAQTDPALRDLQVFQGMTWLPAHGEVVGFVSTPMPKGWKRVALAAHFRLLSWVFAPSVRIRERQHAAPRLYWLTRASLTANLGKLKPEPASNVQRDAHAWIDAGVTS
jgi:YkoP domain